MVEQNSLLSRQTCLFNEPIKINMNVSLDTPTSTTPSVKGNHLCGLERNQHWQQALQYPDTPISLDVSYTDYKKMRNMIEYPQKGEVARDVLRTFPQHSFFRVESIGSKMLSNILHIFVLCRPEIGYCQGMNFVTAIFMLGRIPSEYSGGLMLNKVHSFTTTINNTPSSSSSSKPDDPSSSAPTTPHRKVNDNLNNAIIVSGNDNNGSDKFYSSNSDKISNTPSTPIFINNTTDTEEVVLIEYEVLQSMLLLADKHSKLSMCTLWHSRQSQVKLRAYQFDQLCKWIVPKLHLHFHEIHLAPEVLVAQWFVTLFSYTVPLRITMKLWDYIFLYGWTGMFQIALSLLKCFEDSMLKLDLEGVSGLLKRWRLRSQEYHDSDDNSDIASSDGGAYNNENNRSISVSTSALNSGSSMDINSNSINNNNNNNNNNNSNRRISASNESYSSNTITNRDGLIKSTSSSNNNNTNDNQDDHNITYDEIMSHVDVMPINNQVLQKLQESFALEMISMSEVTISKSEPVTPSSGMSGSSVRNSKESERSNSLSQNPPPRSRSKTTATAAAALSSIFSNNNNSINHSKVTVNSTVGKSFSSNSVSTTTSNTSSATSNTNWLDRYCDVISMDVAKDMLRIRDDLNLLELQIDADKEHIQSKIIAACDTHREAQVSLENAQQLHSHSLTTLVSLTEELDGVLSRGQEIAAAVYTDLEEYNMHTGGGSGKKPLVTLTSTSHHDGDTVTITSTTLVTAAVINSINMNQGNAEVIDGDTANGTSNYMIDAGIVDSSVDNNTSNIDTVDCRASDNSPSDSFKLRSNSNYDDISVQVAAVVATLSHSIKSIHDVTSAADSSDEVNSDSSCGYVIDNKDVAVDTANSSSGSSSSTPSTPTSISSFSAVLSGHHSSFWSSRKKSAVGNNNITTATNSNKNSNSNHSNNSASNSSSGSGSGSFFSRNKSAPASSIETDTDVLTAFTTTPSSSTATNTTRLSGSVEDDGEANAAVSTATTTAEMYGEDTVSTKLSRCSDSSNSSNNNSDNSDTTSDGSSSDSSCEIELVPITVITQTATIAISTDDINDASSSRCYDSADNPVIRNDSDSSNDTLSHNIYNINAYGDDLHSQLPVQQSSSSSSSSLNNSSSSSSSSLLFETPKMTTTMTVPITSLSLSPAQKSKRIKLLKQRMASLSTESRQVQQQVISLQRELIQAKAQLTTAKDQLSTAYTAEEEAVERKRLLCEQFQRLVEDATRGRSQKLQYITDMYL